MSLSIRYSHQMLRKGTTRREMVKNRLYFKTSQLPPTARPSLAALAVWTTLISRANAESSQFRLNKLKTLPTRYSTWTRTGEARLEALGLMLTLS